MLKRILLVLVAVASLLVTQVPVSGAATSPGMLVNSLQGQVSDHVLELSWREDTEVSSDCLIHMGRCCRPVNTRTS